MFRRLWRSTLRGKAGRYRRKSPPGQPLNLTPSINFPMSLRRSRNGNDRQHLLPSSLLSFLPQHDLKKVQVKADGNRKWDASPFARRTRHHARPCHGLDVPPEACGRHVRHRAVIWRLDYGLTRTGKRRTIRRFRGEEQRAQPRR